MTTETTTTIVTIPGQVFAHIEADGTVSAIYFTPAASDAGYFGPAAEWFDGPDGDDDDLVGDLETFDGTFWRGVQHYLAAAPGISDRSIGWRE